MSTAFRQIRHYRTQKKLSLQAVAGVLGMSISQLSKIESGKAKLTVETAIRIAAVLQVPAANFLVDYNGPSKGRRSVTRQDGGQIFKTEAMRFEVLSADFKDKQNMFWKVRIHARSVEANGGWRQHPGEEFLYVLSGTLELHTLLYEPLVMAAGDSILFDSDQHHAYVSVSEDDAEVLMMNTLHSTSPAAKDND